MIGQASLKPFIAIACGGTGGHLFPGMAVAEPLRQWGCAVALLISSKEVDQQAVRSAAGVDIVALPAIGLTRGRRLAFIRGFVQSYRLARQQFRKRPPHAALAMGGFTSAPPILAARRAGARAYLHESNTVPGRANRWLAWFVERAFVGFPEAADRMHARQVTVTGTPVRPEFQPRDPAACRAALGFDPARPLVLVMGGSQGASGINELVVRSLGSVGAKAPHWQWLHLSGPNDFEKTQRAYREMQLTAVVHPFLDRMDLALGAATAAVSRAGASSLAELAAVQVPALLIPFPAATDNHQLHNARALETAGAARMLDQKSITPESLTETLMDLMANDAGRGRMQAALAKAHRPRAAEQIALAILEALGLSVAVAPRLPGPGQIQRRPLVVT